MIMNSFYKFFIGSLILGQFLQSCGTKMQDGPGELKYHFYVKNDTARKGEIGDVFLLDVIVENKDSILLNTNELKRKLKFELGAPLYPGDLQDILSLLNKGDSALFEWTLDSTYPLRVNSSFGFNVSKGDRLQWAIGCKGILSPEEHYQTMLNFEKNTINAYMKKYSWLPNYDSAYGINYEYLVKKPDAPKINNFDSVQYNYIITDLENRLIEGLKPGNFITRPVIDFNQMDGLARCLRYMRKGEKIRAIVPFEKAYGAEGTQFVPPYTTVLITIETK